MQPLIAGCWRPRIESCTMQISLVCIIARDRADHSSIDRSVPAVDLLRPSSAARQCGNAGGRSIRWAYEVKEELVVRPAEFYVQVLKRGKCVVRASGGARVRSFLFIRDQGGARLSRSWRWRSVDRF